jgi:hypothetical protein
VKADLTRDSFDIMGRYSQVLMQQGRVQLDADWNEQGRILLHLMRSAVADTIGPAGGRAETGWPNTPGYGVAPLSLGTAPTAVSNDFIITPGRYYVDGVLCELDAEPMAVRLSSDGKSVVVPRWTLDGRSFAVGQYLRIVQTKLTDPGDFTAISAVDYANLTLTLDPPVTAPTGGQSVRATLQRLTTYLTQPDVAGPIAPLAADAAVVILDVWERAVTCLEDPAIREIALGLGGPDTAARVRTEAQVRVLPGLKSCMTSAQIADALSQGDPGLMRARAQPDAASTDVCIIDPDAGYRGPENQLYRVEVHAGGNTAPSFKWSRENASVLFGVIGLDMAGGDLVITLSGLGRDDRYGLAVGDIVELEDDMTILAAPAQPIPLLQVKSIDVKSRTVVADFPPGFPVNQIKIPSPLPSIRLRRWDQTGELGPDLAIAIPLAGAAAPSDWIDLEDGVQVQFAPLDDVFYRAGDYWLIPARVATGDVLWPKETWTDAKGAIRSAQALRSPSGVVHHYASLGVIQITDKKAIALQKSCQVVLGA